MGMLIAPKPAFCGPLEETTRNNPYQTDLGFSLDIISCGFQLFVPQYQDKAYCIAKIMEKDQTVRGDYIQF